MKPEPIAYKPPPLRIAVPVVESTVNRARGRYLRAARRGLMTELRLDYLEEPPDLKRLFRTRPGPVIATNRHPEEGGRWRGSENDRLDLLMQTLDFGVDYIDVESRTDPRWLQELHRRLAPQKTRLIISCHDFSGTPDDGELKGIMDLLFNFPADIYKIVTLARRPEDNLRVLSLIPQVRARGAECIAFCMGPVGKWSRVAAPLLGSYLSYAPFSRKGASAPGQFTVHELQRLWRALK